ncbi:MAG: Minf_1886 family protein [bacterium]
MNNEKSFEEIVEEIVQKDHRYKAESYSFVMSALGFTQNKLKRNGHVSGQELLKGIQDVALELFGPMARTVFEHWGIYKTEDFGHIVFNMVNSGLMGKTDSDSIDDFKDIYDFKKVFDEAPFPKINLKSTTKKLSCKI